MSRSLSLRVRTPNINYRTQVEAINSSKNGDLAKSIAKMHEKLREKKREYIDHMRRSEMRKKSIISEAVNSRMKKCVILILS